MNSPTEPIKSSIAEAEFWRRSLILWYRYFSAFSVLQSYRSHTIKKASPTKSLEGVKMRPKLDEESPHLIMHRISAWRSQKLFGLSRSPNYLESTLSLILSRWSLDKWINVMKTDSPGSVKYFPCPRFMYHQPINFLLKFFAFIQQSYTDLPIRLIANQTIRLLYLN